MPTVPSGILYFMVWKYGLYGGLLFIGSRIFKYLGVFDVNPLGGIAVLSGIVLLPVLWFEHGDNRLSQLWQVDAERTNCDRMAKAFLYVCCCIVWPRFVISENR
jgi:hypothetical protein